ncbi:RagB/SusD family nutrient uptake outer membrane protein [Bacteroides heparinolyticus]|uniref:RagB/SusD family nutrient uptake outer membrane protein n=1 Tax=Prevotella heparinolytica TaxID=28113 RepID=UPI0035A07D24
MKNIIYKSLLMLSLAGAMTSCDLEAPSVSAMEEPNLFSVRDLAEGAVMGIHQSFGETNSYRGRFLPYYGINTDLEWINNIDPAKIADDGKYELCTYATRPTNSQMNTDNNAWAKFYEGIERANLCIRGLRTYADLTNPDFSQLLGEAITLRAVLYLDLVKGWGDVPGRFEPNSSETVYLPRMDRDSIYIRLLNDLKEASDMVSWPNGSTVTKSTERINKAFVKGLRARIALYAAGYSQRADGIRRSNSPELTVDKMYAIAKEECIDIINNSGCVLGNFIDNFKKLCQDNTAAGGESLWEVPFSAGRGRVLYTFGVKHKAKDQYTEQAQGGINGPLPYLFYDYDVEDVRRDITCVPYEWSSNLVNGKAKQEVRSLKSWCFGKLRYEWMNRIVTSTNDDGVNWQYMRLADVYLMAAEAINELESPAAAAPYLKPILERALPAAKVSAYMTKATANKEAFFNAIVEQRGFEFAGESLRKADLIRWNLLKTKMDEAKEKMKQLARREGAYADLPEKLYYKIDKDEETLLFYGLNHGETGNAPAGYESVTWINTEKLTDELINSLYQKNPDENQFWPIWQTFIDNSNGMLSND